MKQGFFCLLFSFSFSISAFATGLSVDEVEDAARCASAVYEDANNQLPVVHNDRYVFGAPAAGVGAVFGQAPLTSCGEIFVRQQRPRVVACRGTVSVEEWMQNANIALRDFNPLDANAGRVHSGFFDHVDNFYNHFSDELRRSGYHDGDSLTITGHSLGAASAVILALRFLSDNQFAAPERIRLVLFSSPRMGDSNFVDFLEGIIPKEDILHFYCTKDIVPGVPLNGRTSPLIGCLAQGCAALGASWLSPDYDDMKATSIPISFLEASFERMNLTRAGFNVVLGEVYNYGLNYFGYGRLAQAARNAERTRAVLDLIPIVAITNHACHPRVARSVYADYRSCISMGNMFPDEFAQKDLFYSSERNPIFRFFS